MLAAVNGRSSLLRRWEDLHPGVQVVGSFVVAFVVLVIAHIALLNQPLGRALWYGLFWGAIVTLVVVLGTRAERAKRMTRERDGRR